LAVDAIRKTALAGAALGRPAAEPERLRALAAGLARDIDARLRLEDGRYVDGIHADGRRSDGLSQIANAYPLAFGLVDGPSPGRAWRAWPFGRPWPTWPRRRAACPPSAASWTSPGSGRAAATWRSGSASRPTWRRTSSCPVWRGGSGPAATSSSSLRPDRR